MSATLYETALKELEESEEDLRPSDVVSLSEPLRSALNFVIRLGRFSLSEFSEKLEFTQEQTKTIADRLVQRKLFEIAPYSTANKIFYTARLSATTRPLTRPPSDVWKKID